MYLTDNATTVTWPTNLYYVPVAVTVTVPANTSFSIKHQIAAVATRVVDNKAATAAATAAVYYLGETDISNQLTFYPYYDSGSRSGTDARELNTAYQGKSSATITQFNLNAAKALDYANTTDAPVEVTHYFGLMLTSQYGSTYMNTLSAQVTFDSTVYYNLYVAGTQVTSENAADVLGDGAASYDLFSNTLTVSKDIAATGNSRVISNKGTGTLNVNVISNATLSAQSAIAIGAGESSGSLNITVAHGKTLTVTSGTTYGAIYATDDITVTGGVLNVTGTGGYALRSGGKLTVSDDCEVYATGSSGAVYAGSVALNSLTALGNTAYQADKAACTQEAAFSGKTFQLGGATAKTVVTKSAAKYGLWVGGVQVTSANAKDILGDGKVSYTADTNTLNLNNATVKWGDVPVEGDMIANAVIYSNLESLNICYSGTCTLDGTNAGNNRPWAIYGRESSVTLTGDAEAKLYARTTEYAIAVEVHNLTVAGYVEADGMNICGIFLDEHARSSYTEVPGQLTVLSGSLLSRLSYDSQYDDVSALYLSGAAPVIPDNYEILGSTNRNAAVAAFTAAETCDGMYIAMAGNTVGAKAVLIAPAAQKHTHTGITGAFTEWTATNGTVSTSGNYYLADNVTAADNITISGNVTLCLNGHTLDIGSKWLINNGTLTVCDCTAEQEGKLTSSGDRCIHNYGTVYILGGTVETSRANNAYGINNASGVVHISGGTVTGPFAVATNAGCTVYLSGAPAFNSVYADILSWGGELYAQSNDAVPAAYSGSELVLDFSSSITAGTTVVKRVTAANKGLFTTRNANYYLVQSGSDLVLAEVITHTHSWATEWTANATHHWHECTADGCEVTEDSGKDGYAAHKTSGLCDCGGVVINETNFPDANFRTYLTDTLNKGGDDGFFTAAELAAITTINPYRKSIASLAGIEYFTELKYLECYNNQLETLDLSKNTKIVSIKCQENKLTALNITGLSSLSYLYCHDNKLTALDTTTNIALLQLWGDNNDLSSIDVRQNTNLTILYVRNSNLTALDVGQNTKLTELDCADNDISELDISNNTKLTFLSCGSNELTKLDISKNTELKTAYLSGNKLLSLNVKSNTALTWLECSNNRLTNLDLSNNTKLSSLSCSGNNLTSLDLSNNTNISTLNGQSQTASITIDQKTMTFDMAALDSSFDSSKAAVTTEGCSFNGTVLTVKEGINKVAYTYATGIEGKTLSVTLTVTNPHTHKALADDGNCLTEVLCQCEKVMVAAKTEHVSTGDNVATYTKKPVCDVCGTEYGNVLPDNIAPSGKIVIKNNSYLQFFNTVTFGWFWKDYVEITVTGDDAQTGVAKVEYTLSDVALSGEAVKSIASWKPYERTVRVDADAKHFVYAKITDKAGNAAYISVNGGIVVFTDTEITTGEYEYTLTAKTDIVTNIKPGRHAVNMIDICEPGGNAGDMLDYFINSDGYIVLKGDSLEDFTEEWYAGNYTVTIMYNALGEEYADGASKGDKITDTVLTLTVKRCPVEKPAANTSVFTYTGTVQTYTLTQNQAYTVTGNTRTQAGSQSVTVSLEDTDKYCWTDGTSGDLTFTFAIGKATPEIGAVSAASPEKIYFNTELSQITLKREAAALPGSLTLDAGQALTVGTKDYNWTFTPQDTDNYNTVKGKVSLTVNKIPLDVSGISWDTSRFPVTYDGTKKTVNLTGTLPEGVVAELSGNTGIDARGYTAKAVFSLAQGYENYEIVGAVNNTLTANWEIYPKTVAPVIEIFGVSMYDGTHQEPGVTVYDGDREIPAGEYNVDYADNLEAGTAKVTVTDVAGGNYTVNGTKNFTVEKAVFTAQVAQKDALTYTGLEQTASVTEATQGVQGNQEVTFLYGLTPDSCTESDVPAFKNADTYTVYFTASAPNHQDTAGSFTVTVGKKALTVTAWNSTVTYGEAPRGRGYTCSGFVNGEGYLDLNGEVTYVYTYQQYGNVGSSYTLTPTGFTSQNYDISYVSGTLTVLPLEAQLQWSSLPANGLTYDGTQKVLTATVVNAQNGDDVSFAVTLMGDNVNVTEEGFAYSVTGLTGLKAGNYCLGDTLESPRYYITKAVPPAQFPQNLHIGTTQTLADVDLTGYEGYTFDAPDTAVAYGVHQYPMTFTPADTDNFITLQADVPVRGDDVTAPTAQMTVGENSWSSFWNNVTFGLFFKETQTVTVTAQDTESGIGKTEYYLAPQETADFTDVLWTEFDNTFSIDPSNAYVVYVKVTDAAQNALIINSDGVVLDNILPILSGIEEGRTYHREVTVSVTDVNFHKVTVSGEEVPVTDGSFTLTAKDENQTVQAFDKAGNESLAITVFVEAEHSFLWGQWQDNGDGSHTREACCACGAQLTVTAPKNGELVAEGLEKEAEKLGRDLELTVRDWAIHDWDAFMAIGEAIPEHLYADLVEITVTDTAEDTPISQTQTVLEIPIAFDFADVLELGVYRYHQGTTARMTALESRPTGDFTDGTVFPDEENGIIYLYSSRFSTFAIAYHIHELTYVPEKAPTKEADGNIEYWYCPDCHSYFADAEAQEQISQEDTVVKYVQTPPTGDSASLGLWALLMLVSAAAITGLCFKGKKQF